MYKRIVPVLIHQLNFSFCRRRVLFSKVKIHYFQITHNKPFLVSARDFAKTKDKKKDVKKKVQIDENELEEVFNVEKLYVHLKEPIDLFKEDLATHTVLRSSIHSFENLKITYEGQEYKLQNLAEIGKKSEKMYIIDISAFPNASKTILSALQKSEMNLNVQQEGLKIYIPIPKVTKEYRENLMKKSKTLFTKCRNSIKDVQNKYIKKLNNIENLSEELKFRVIDQLNELGDQHIKTAEKILKEKEQELLKN